MTIKRLKIATMTFCWTNVFPQIVGEWHLVVRLSALFVGLANARQLTNRILFCILGSEQKNWNFTCEFISLFTFTTPTTKTPGYVLRRSWKRSKWNSKTTSILKALSSAEHQSFWLSTPFPTSRTQWSTQALQVCTLWTGSTNSSRN